MVTQYNVYITAMIVRILIHELSISNSRKHKNDIHCANVIIYARLRQTVSIEQMCVNRALQTQMLEYKKVVSTHVCLNYSTTCLKKLIIILWKSRRECK